MNFVLILILEQPNVEVLASLDDFHLCSHSDLFATLGVLEQRYHLHTQHWMSTSALVNVSSCLFEGLVGLCAVFDACFGIDVRQIATCCAAANVVVEVS